MSAERLGKILLEDVKEERLDELLSSLRALESSASTSTGLLAVDQLLAVFQDPGRRRRQQRQQQQWDSANWLSTNPSPQPPNPVKELLPPVLEITSISHGSGKTQLLYLIITLALLPQSYNDIPLNGKSSAIILLDLSNKFSILRLRDVITSYIKSRASTYKSHSFSPADISYIVQTSLLHLHIFRPQSSSSLLATISSLPSHFLSQPPSHSSSSRKISILILNDLSAFHYQDQQQHQTSNTPTTNNQPPKAPPLTQTYRSLIPSLKSLQSTFACLILATTSSLSTPSPLPAGPYFTMHRHTPTIWNAFCPAQLIIERTPTPKFGPAISAQEAELDRAKRQDAVRVGERRGRVNWRDCEFWREEVREGVRGWERGWGGHLGFFVEGGGVRVLE